MSEAFKHHVRMRLTGLLHRMRQTIQFPFAPEEVYKAAFPDSKVAGWLHSPILTDLIHRKVAYRNMVSCTHRGAVVHFLLDSPAEVAAVPNNLGQQVFWVKFEHPVARPLNAAFILSDSLRTSKPMLDWYNSAWLMEDTINNLVYKTYACVNDIQNPSEFALAWPEVANAVPGIVPDGATLRAAARSHRIKRLRNTVLSHFPLGEDREMDKFTSMLASALLLPDVTYPQTWVGSHPLFEEDLP